MYEFDYSLFDKSIRKRKKIQTIIARTLVSIAIIISLSTLLFNIVFFSSEVIGISMQPTYNKLLKETDDAETSIYKDTTIVNRYNKGKNGDIVILSMPQEIVEDKNMSSPIIIKRIIASNNEKITLKYDPELHLCKFFINDKPLDEPYLKEKIDEMNKAYFDRFCSLPNITKSSPNEANYQLKQDEIFVLGDNRFVSCDSSIFGAINKSCVLGKVAFSYEYNETLLSKLWEIFLSIF